MGTSRLRAAASALAAFLFLGGLAEAACTGSDFLPRLKEQRPDDFARLDAVAQKIPFGRGKFFRLSKKGLTPSYLYGTMHDDDPRITAFSPKMLAALKSARAVALELDPDTSLSPDTLLETLGLTGMAKFLARRHERADRLLEPADFKRLEEILTARGLPSSAARVAKPALLAVLLALPKCIADEDEEDDVDTLIGKKGAEGGRDVVGLETMLEQMSALTDFDADVQRELLLGLIKSTPHIDDFFETTLVRYAAGEIGTILAMMETGIVAPGVTVPTPAAFVKVLITDRNLRMRDRALPLLRKGGAFIAVGAAHLPGEQGLARLFEKSGFRVERVE